MLGWNNKKCQQINFPPLYSGDLHLKVKQKFVSLDTHWH